MQQDSGRRGPVCDALRTFLALAILLLSLSAARAQDPAQVDQQPTLVVPLPLSGRTPGVGTVTTTDRTAPGGTPGSVDLIQSTVTVQPPYNGSVPEAPRADGARQLTLEQALGYGLRYNLGAVTESTAVMQAHGQRLVARSALLPNLNSVGTEALEQTNLRTVIGNVGGSMFPTANEFNYFDLRAAKLKQTVFDLVSVHSLHSSSATLQAALSSVHNARDLIVLAVGGSYLRITATRDRVAAAAAEVETARAIFVQAADRFAAGLAPRIDSTRARVQLQTEQERLRSLQGDLDTQKLALARLIGLPLEQEYSVAASYSFQQLLPFRVEEAIPIALARRPDLLAASQQVEAAEQAVKAAHAERLPNLKVTGDVGVAGLRPTADVSSVYTVAGVVTIPIFEGGRISGDVEQASAALKQRQAEMADLKGQIDFDVRQALIQLRTAADEVAVAQSNKELSHETLTQSRDRFVAGVADTVEVVQAEQAVVQADDDLIVAVYQHNLAKVSLARAMGNAEQTLPQLLRTK